MDIPLILRTGISFVLENYLDLTKQSQLYVHRTCTVNMWSVALLLTGTVYDYFYEMVK